MFFPPRNKLDVPAYATSAAETSADATFNTLRPVRAETNARGPRTAASKADEEARVLVVSFCASSSPVRDRATKGSRSVTFIARRTPSEAVSVVGGDVEGDARRRERRNDLYYT